MKALGQESEWQKDKRAKGLEYEPDVAHRKLAHQIQHNGRVKRRARALPTPAPGWTPHVRSTTWVPLPKFVAL